MKYKNVERELKITYTDRDYYNLQSTLKTFDVSLDTVLKSENQTAEVGTKTLMEEVILKTSTTNITEIIKLCEDNKFCDFYLKTVRKLIEINTLPQEYITYIISEYPHIFIPYAFKMFKKV